MRVERTVHAGVEVIAVRGALDGATAAEVRDVGAGGRPVLLDLSGASGSSLSGLRVLLLVRQRARRAAVRLALAGAPPEVRGALATTGLLDEFLITDTVDEAIRALAANNQMRGVT